jgi:dUTP pyrophosphatase
MSNFNDVSEKEMQDMLKFLDSLDDENNDVDYNAIMETLGLDIPELEKEIQEYIPTIDLSYKKTKENAIDPKYAYISDSGFDLYSTEDVWIHSLDRQLVSTGLHFDIPEGYEIQVRSKSGLALKQGLMVLNSPGTVDQGYLGEIKIILFNTTREKVKIEKGQKIAQAVLCPVVSGKWVKLTEKNDLGNKDRNDNGFGSTGLK